MKLTGPYRITVTGDTSQLGGGQSVEGIGHLFQRLLCGEDAVMENLANLGIEVRRFARPEDVTEEEVEAAMADSYVSLPIADYAALAAAVNKMLEARFGVSDD